MVPKENGEAREELKETESDCEPGRNSVSSQGESQSTEEIMVRRPSRVPKNLTRKETTEGNSRSRRVSGDRHESNKLHFKASINNGKKSQKPDIVMSSSKSLSDLRNENAKISAKASSESSEGADEKNIEENGTEEFKEIDIADETPNCDQSVGTDNETIETEENSLDEEKANPYQKIEEMESRIEKLEEELREVAALEISLYSVVPEHGSSAHKLHTPARRLSRLYIHACKHGTQQQKASVAKNTVSGLVLIAKSCGNDVARLTFWLSNMVVLREIMSQAFGISSGPLSRMSAEANGIANKSDGKVSSQKWRSKQGNKAVTKPVLLKLVDDWQETSTFTSALERIESWMFSRIVESVWWQTLTPHMQGPPEGSYRSRGPGKLLGPPLGDHQQGNFSIDLWTDAFLDGFMRLCPVRAGGHECGCLPVLAKMVMIQCVSRLDVAMFNAILRESANEIPTDPVSDPILDAKVLPMPAGDLSFGSGAQLKNSIGSWSRWLAELLGMDVDVETKYEESMADDDRSGGNIESKCFPLLSSLSDLLMLPKDMLLDKSIRMEVCPSIGLSLITRILCNFTPDEFCPDPVPGIVLEELNAERMSERRLSEKDPSFPYAAAPVVYCAPTVVDVAQKVADVNGGKVELGRNASVIQRRGYTSDEELDDLDSPLASIIDKTPPVSPANANGKLKDNSTQTSVRFELLREVWSA